MGNFQLWTIVRQNRLKGMTMPEAWLEAEAARIGRPASPLTAVQRVRARCVRGRRRDGDDGQVRVAASPRRSATFVLRATAGRNITTRPAMLLGLGLAMSTSPTILIPDCGASRAVRRAWAAMGTTHRATGLTRMLAAPPHHLTSPRAPPPLHIPLRRHYDPRHAAIGALQFTEDPM